MRKLLSVPHPIGFGWAYALIPAFAVLFILTILGPYGFANLPFIERLPRALPFAVITGLAAPINLMIAKSILPKSMDEANWTIGHEFIYNTYDIVLIGFWNATFLHFIGKSEAPFIELLLRIELHTLMIGIIPIIALIGFKNSESLKKQLSQVRKINEELKKEKVKAAHDLVSFYSENGKFEIKLFPRDILFLKSDGNYLEIFYKKNEDNEAKHLIRNRLKHVSDLLPKETFFQCHKSYIINLEKINRIDRNARDLTLYLYGSKHEIPVSRSKSGELLEALKK